MQYGNGLVIVYVQDMQKAKSFYVDGLGLELVPQLSSDSFAFLNVANGTPIALQSADTKPEGVEVRPGGIEISFVVDDAQAALNEWKQRGLNATSDLFDMGAGMMFAGQDPDGNRVSVHHIYPEVAAMRGQPGGTSSGQGPQ